MDKLKFRVYNKKTREWYDEESLILWNGQVYESFHYLEDYMAMNPDDIHLMQFIGVKDKSGTEMYEGDLVQYLDGEFSFVGQIKRDCYKFYIEITAHDRIGFISFCDTTDGNSILEIIGNIYDNPELLEEYNA